MPPRQDDIPDGFVAVGRVLGAFGVRGEVKVEPLAPPEVFQRGSTLHLAGQPRTVEGNRRGTNHLLLKIEGVHDREDAAALRGQYLTLPETDLAPAGEDTYYHFQLIGLRVVSTEGEELGEIAEVMSTGGGNDVFVVRGPRGEILIPSVDEFVQEVDIEGGRMLVEVIPGLLP